MADVLLDVFWPNHYIVIDEDDNLSTSGVHTRVPRGREIGLGQTNRSYPSAYIRDRPLHHIRYYWTLIDNYYLVVGIILTTCHSNRLSKDFASIVGRNNEGYFRHFGAR